MNQSGESRQEVNHQHKTGPGASGFSKQYWDDNYYDINIMDGIYNAKQHASYLHALFELEEIYVGTIIDYGFGLGYLMQALLDAFKPYSVVGIEPSAHAFQEVKSREPLTHIETMHIELIQTDMLSWFQQNQRNYLQSYDLGICTSVFQYLSDDEIHQVMPWLALWNKYLYFSVPTDIELQYQVEELGFHDRYAIHRSQETYHEMLSPHFTIVSTRVLESKVHFTTRNTLFQELFYRF
ncbi:MAG: class I SAM-dependent methyltransferase [Chloroflexota bacterium]